MISFFQMILLLLILSCARVEPELRDQAMRPSQIAAKLDLLTIEDSFKESLHTSLKALKRRPNKILFFGECRVSSLDYARTIEHALKSFEGPELNQSLSEYFQWYAIYGKEEWGKVLLTSYYSPEIDGRLEKEGDYTYPLFTVPKDLVEVEMKKFSQGQLISSQVARSVVSGRLIKGPGRVERVVPYYSRSEIDTNFDLLSGKAKIHAYVKPVEAFFLHIQGSGTIRLKSGKRISLGYAAQNGHRYFSIGKLLYDRIPKEEMTKAKIEEHLGKLSDEELFEFLGTNPSYVFFEELESGLGRTTYGPQVIERGTIAVDPSLISLGSLAYLEYDSPTFINEQDKTPVGFNREARLVWAHDAGGAIKGAGRADLYWGRGSRAGEAAGVINQRAKLWILGPKVCHSGN